MNEQLIAVGVDDLVEVPQRAEAPEPEAEKEEAVADPGGGIYEHGYGHGV